MLENKYMTTEQAVLLLEKKEWKFAKTAAKKNPHWYILKQNYGNDEEFLQLVKYIRANGEVEWFWKLKYLCLYYKGWKYWTMHTSDETVTLINKTFISDQYETIAPIYNNLFKDDISIQENIDVISMFKNKIDENDVVLDIGCGTGMLLDYIDIKNYVGIDSSKSMIKIAKANHPKDYFICTKYETYDKGADFIVSLFGSMNYVIDLYLPKIYDILQSKGYYFLMFYKEDYSPITYDKAGKQLYHYKYTKDKLRSIFISANITEFNNYYIVTNI